MKKLKEAIVSFYMNLKMSKRLSVIFTVLFLVALLTMSILYQHIYKNDIQDTTIMSFEQITISYEVTLSSVFQKLDAMTLTPLYSKQMQNEMKWQGVLSEESKTELYYASEVLGRSNRSYFISLYNMEGDMVYTTAPIDAVYATRRYGPQWVEIAANADGSSRILALPQGQTDYACVAVRLIKDTEQFENIGVMAIAVANSVFEDVCTQIEKNPSIVAVALDSNGDVFFCSDPDTDGIPQELLEVMEQRDDKGSTVIETPKYLGYYTSASRGKYSFLMYTSLEALLINQRQSQLVMTMLAVLICVLTVITTKYIASGTTSPLSKMTTLMREVQKGDYSVRFNVLYKDEIGIMAASFNAMMDKLDEMTKHIVSISVRKKQIEIDTLQQQINPHFLYNTLEKYRMMAVSRDDYEMADQICLLGKLMRYNTTAMNKMTTLAQEIEFLEYYLSIQNSGNNRKIQLKTEIAEELLEYPIVKLLLQPVVENSIFHGLKVERKETAMIWIRAKADHDTIQLTITDNGVGIPADKLEEVRSNICIGYEEGGSAHIGLRNVNARIQLFYGEQYGLSIDSESGRGTQVHIKLPYTS